MKYLAALSDLSRDDAENVLKLAAAYRDKHQRGCRFENVLGGKVVAMIFEKL